MRDYEKEEKAIENLKDVLREDIEEEIWEDIMSNLMGNWKDEDLENCIDKIDKVLKDKENTNGMILYLFYFLCKTGRIKLEKPFGKKRKIKLFEAEEDWILFDDIYFTLGENDGE